MSLIRPNFFIVGAPKCGTTAMNDYLAQHPDIFMAKKEIHYFGSDLKTKLKISRQEYLKYFEKAGEEKIIGEASVWYLFSKEAAREIKEFSSVAKILIMLRNPVEVIYSLHSQHLYDGNEDITDFETALNLDEERKKGNKLPSSVDYYELPSYRDSVLFAGQVKRYLDTFGSENVHIVLYDDFLSDTRKVVAGTLSFLGIENSGEIDYKIINPNKEIRFFPIHRLIKKPSKRLKGVVRIILPFKKIRHSVMSYLFKKNTRTKKRQKMNSRLQSELMMSLAGDIKELSKIINRDLSAWTQ
jgi:Sulfotransferase domain